MKICTKCKQEFSATLENFYGHFTNKDRLFSKCKKCIAIRNRKFRQTEQGKLYMKVYQKAHRQLEKTKSAHRQRQREYRLAFPEKIKAHHIVNTAISADYLRGSVFCERCGLPAKTQGHHKDYSRPLEIDWVCEICHKAIHKRHIY